MWESAVRHSYTNVHGSDNNINHGDVVQDIVTSSCCEIVLGSPTTNLHVARWEGQLCRYGRIHAAWRDATQCRAVARFQK